MHTQTLAKRKQDWCLKDPTTARLHSFVLMHTQTLQYATLHCSPCLALHNTTSAVHYTTLHHTAQNDTTQHVRQDTTLHSLHSIPVRDSTNTTREFGEIVSAGVYHMVLVSRTGFTGATSIGIRQRPCPSPSSCRRS